MVDREALEQFERDPNPYAVDPRLTEGSDTAVPRSDEVLEYRRRVTWAMIDWKRLLGGAFQIVLIYLIGYTIMLVAMGFFLNNPSLHTPFFYRMFFLRIGFTGLIFFVSYLFITLIFTKIQTYRLAITPERVMRHTGIVRSFSINTHEITEISVVTPFRFMKFTNGLPVKHAISLRQSSWKFMTFPCRDAEDQEQMLREIEQFLKRY